MSNFAELIDLDPTRSPQEEFIQGVNGESYHLWRQGPTLEVNVSCWSSDRLPELCCPWDGPTARRPCWGQAGFLQDFCCGMGISADKTMWYNVYARLTSHLSPAERLYFNQILPEEKIDEAAFDAKRMLWALGHHPPSQICAAASETVDGVKVGVDGSTALWPLAVLLAAEGANLSGTFINLGAGTCLHPDPLYQLLSSPHGSGFLGLAVEAALPRLQTCQREMAGTFATVVPVPLTLDPIHAAQQLGPYVAAMFPNQAPPWTLDFLVVDLDGPDCLIAEELMQLVRPKVIMLEMAFHIPPPFRFSAHWDAKRSGHWNANYDIDQYNAASGCSLSYALHKFKLFGYHLLRPLEADAVFVHDSVKAMFESSLGLKLPQDEFLCYRSSTLWLQMPGRYVREWFYAPHPSLVFSQIWSNISVLNREMGREDAPFTLDF
eukprot:Skav215765  [mRNA]  locus=scaffold106:387551:388855:- [translate_table: standard]